MKLEANLKSSFENDIDWDIYTCGYYAAKAHEAKKRGLEFGFTLEQFKKLLSNPVCAYTGVPLTYVAKKPNSLSLERIDPYTGYIPSNVVLVSSQVNTIKNQLDSFAHSVSPALFKTVINKVANRINASGWENRIAGSDRNISKPVMTDEVKSYLLDGFTTKEIVETLGVSESKITTSRNDIKKELIRKGFKESKVVDFFCNTKSFEEHFGVPYDND